MSRNRAQSEYDPLIPAHHLTVDPSAIVVKQYAYDNFFFSLFSIVVLKQIWFRVLLVTLVSVTLVIVDSTSSEFRFPTISVTAHTLLGLALGLLLVFRTNSAYDRFWEGRKAWGQMMRACRCLGRMFAHVPQLHSTADPLHHLLIAFLVAVKCRLRGLQDKEELAKWLQPVTNSRVQRTPNHPTAILCFVSQFFADRLNADKSIVVNQWVLAEQQLNDCQQATNDCERIVMTPVPFPYVIQIRQILFLYLITLPFVLQGAFQSWSVAIATFIVAFSLFGVEEIGHLIENPFGTDVCDLPLDEFVHTIDNGLNSFLALRRSGGNEIVDNSASDDKKQDQLPSSSSSSSSSASVTFQV